MLAEVLPHLPQEVRQHPLKGAVVGPLAPRPDPSARGFAARRVGLGGDVVDLAVAMQVGQQSLADQTLDCLVQLQRRLAATAAAELLAVDEYLKTAIEGDGVQVAALRGDAGRIGTLKMCGRAGHLFRMFRILSGDFFHRSRPFQATPVLFCPARSRSSLRNSSGGT
jgi:hypothetical protein